MPNFLPPGTPGGFGGPPVPNSFHKAIDPFGLFGGGGPSSRHNVIPNSPHTGQFQQNQGFGPLGFNMGSPQASQFQSGPGFTPGNMAGPGMATASMPMAGNPQPMPSGMGGLNPMQAQLSQQMQPMMRPSMGMPMQGNAQPPPQLGALGQAMMQQGFGNPAARMR
jgi:hypothetical protein